MKVSIITPTFNSAELILETYQSIKNQSHTNWEWLITDDCSSDNTVKILDSIALNDDRVVVMYNDINSGAAVSRNNSLSVAKGDFIAFIDSDDLWMPNKLELQISFMNKHNISFSYTAFNMVSSSGDLLGKVVDSNNMLPVSYEDMLRK
ncbi:glycosyltransferase family 2 protein [Providencia hangzhouensis]